MKKYQNPVSYSDGKKYTNPDPFILRWCGSYYCYSSDAKGVNVSVSEDLVHWEHRGYALQQEGYHQYWAPSVLYWHGKFYMYYSNIPETEEDCHYEWLKVAISDTPEGPFQYEKTFFDEFSIDSHPYIRNGKLYMFYSVNNWYGTEDKIAGTCILIDRMKTPLEFAGTPKLVVAPGLEQEIYEKNRFGDGRDWYTIEGACTVDRNGKSYVLYSANAYENVDYFVGTSIAELKEDALQMEWKKYPNDYTWNPLIRKNDHVEGTGHNTVTKAPNMVDDWMVYHGRNTEDTLIKGTEQRVMRIDPLYYNGDEMLCFGPSYESIPAPAEAAFRIKNTDQNTTVSTRQLLTDTGEYYIAEWWIQGEKHHTGIRYGILLSYQDDSNYVEAVITSGKKEMEVFAHDGSLIYSLGKVSLSAEFDYTVPHKITVERIFDIFRINVEEDVTLEVYYAESAQSADYAKRSGRFSGKTKVGITPYFSKIKICSMALTESVSLFGEELRYITRFYEVMPRAYLRDGICADKGSILLRRNGSDDLYQEEFELEADHNENMFSFYYGNNGNNGKYEGYGEYGDYGHDGNYENDGKADDGRVKAAEGINFTGKCSVTHMVQEGKEIFLINGKIHEVNPVESENRKSCEILLKGLKISAYRYTKI